MEYFSLIGLVFTIHLLAVMSPGPDFIIVLKNAVQHNRKIGIYTALGISFGIGVHIFYTVIGVAYILKQHQNIYNLVKVFGALYIACIGISIWRSHQNNLQVKTVASNNITNWQALKIGFATNILNPKASLFFLSLFTVIIPPHTPNYILVAISLMVIFVTFAWFSVVATAFTVRKTMTIYKQYENIIAKIFSIILIGLGISIIFNL